MLEPLKITHKKRLILTEIDLPGLRLPEVDMVMLGDLPAGSGHVINLRRPRVMLRGSVLLASRTHPLRTPTKIFIVFFRTRVLNAFTILCCRCCAQRSARCSLAVWLLPVALLYLLSTPVRRSFDRVRPPATKPATPDTHRAMATRNRRRPRWRCVAWSTKNSRRACSRSNSLDGHPTNGGTASALLMMEVYQRGVPLWTEVYTHILRTLSWANLQN